MRRHAVILLLAAVPIGLGCGTADEPGRAVPPKASGDVDAGHDAIVRYGCGSCHRIPGVDAADGDVGPPLADLGRRKIIGGRLTNTPSNLARWIRDPQRFDPGVDMPNLGVGPRESRDIAAYLLRGGGGNG
jgi:cytochrome c2